MKFKFIKNKKIIVAINLILILGIVISLVILFYRKEIKIPCDYNVTPAELLKVISDNFNTSRPTDLSIIFIFNKFPSQGDIEVIGKLSYKFKNNIPIRAIFCKKFKYTRMPFDFKFMQDLRFTCSTNKAINDKTNFFVVLKNQKIHFLDTSIQFGIISFMLRKNLSPNLKYEDLAISTDALSKKVLSRIQKGKIRLLNLTSDKEVELDTHNISKIYFFHTLCSPCQLKSMLANLNIKQILENEKKVIIIFSIFGESNRLTPILIENNLKIPIFLDEKDEFDLFSAISNDKESPLLIDLENAKDENGEKNEL